MPDPGHQLTLVFDSDSRAADWLPPGWPGFTFVNRGMPDQTSTQAPRRWATYVEPLRSVSYPIWD